MKYFSTFSLTIFVSVGLSAQLFTLDNVPMTETLGGKPSACPVDQYKVINAANSNANCVTFTTSAFQNGAVWSCNTLNLAQSFNVSFEINFGANTNTGDGMAFLLQEEGVPLVIGGRAGGLGYALGDGQQCNSFPCPISPSLAVEFDTWDNTIDGINDIACHHISLQSNGIMNAANALVPPACMRLGGQAVIDGLNHSVCIAWDPALQLFTVFFDQELIVSYTGNIAALFSTPSLVHWGFTGASGGLAQSQSICDVSMLTNLQSPTCDPFLPLKLVDFQAHCHGDESVKLDWRLEQQQDGALYTLEKSEDAIHFAEIAVFEDNGLNSNLVYSFVDDQAYTIAYYRIKYLSDNTIDYSNIININCSGLEDRPSPLKVYPNPSKTGYLTIDAGFQTIQFLKIYDMSAHLLEELKIRNVNKIELDIHHLNAGLYMVQIITEDQKSYWKHFGRQ